MVNGPSRLPKASSGVSLVTPPAYLVAMSRAAGDPEGDQELEFDDEDGPARPGDTVIDFSTDPPTVWTVPEGGEAVTEPGLPGSG